jgi:hypothetical protein
MRIASLQVGWSTETTETQHIHRAPDGKHRSPLSPSHRTRWIISVCLALGAMAEPSIMCRNIRPLFNFEPPATEEEIRAAALQFVRKVSGSTRPSKHNEDAFARAVDRITAETQKLLAELVTHAPPRDREVERQKARERSLKRFPPTTTG